MDRVESKQGGEGGKWAAGPEGRLVGEGMKDMYGEIAARGSDLHRWTGRL